MVFFVFSPFGRILPNGRIAYGLGRRGDQMAKCHVWPSDRFFLENTGFFHLAMFDLAI
jgi:hypothetical protein